MMLTDLAPVTATLGSLLAVVSLVYVAIQTRQSVRHTRAQIHQGAAARTANLLLGLMNTENAAAWIEGNGGAATPERIREQQFQFQCGLMMVAMEDYFGQHQERLLKEEQFARGCVTFRERLQAPGLRAFWLSQRELFARAAPRYCSFVDALCGDAG
jgi:hypothetical protein